MTQRDDLEPVAGLGIAAANGGAVKSRRLGQYFVEQTGASPRILSNNGARVPPQNPRKPPCPNSSSTISSFTDVRAKLADLQRIEAVLEELVQRCCAAKGDVHCPMSLALQEALRWSS